MTTDFEPTIAERRPIFPMEEVATDRVANFHIWYMAPFKDPTKVATLGRKVPAAATAWVESGMTTKVTERTKQSWQRALARAATIAGTPADAMTRKPGSLPGDREQYRRKGFQICQRVEGEVGNGEYPFRAWRTSMTGGENFIGCREIVAELKRRLPWTIAQMEARIYDWQRRVEAGKGISSSQADYMEAAIGATQEALERLVGPNGRTKDGYDLEACAFYCLPLAEELEAFFIRFDRVLIEASQDARMKEQMARQNQIASLGAAETASLAAAQQALAGVS